MSTTSEHYKVWELIVGVILLPLSVAERVQAVQAYIQQGGPVPDELGDAVRKLLQPEAKP